MRESTEKIDPSACNREILCNKLGGKIQLTVELNKSDDVVLTEDAPAFWKIKYTGKCFFFVFFFNFNIEKF